MARERIYIYDTTSVDGQQTLPARPPAAAKRARTGKGKSGRLPGRAIMARERIYIYDTTLRDGQQTLPARPQPRSERGRAKAKAGVCLGGQ
ncbi:hypothetical protein H712_00662 [Brucella ovis IntaBari-2009-88-4]|nr:hypothetical protein H712_00662 [Brucella ovis IntaBari-2009-88-4]